MSVPSSGKHTDRFSITPTTPAESSLATPSDAPTSTSAPSMHTVYSNRYAELLQILKDLDALPPEALVKSDLPERADRLLKEIHAERKEPVKTARTRRFQLLDKDDSVNRMLVTLEIASTRGNLPTPYPIGRDPLGLEKWVANESSKNVAAIASEFPQLRSALCVYRDATGTNHLARLFHAGSNIDFEIDLRSAKTWQLIPGHDAIHRGPAANFIVLAKSALFHFDNSCMLPIIKGALEEFVAVRGKEDVQSLIRHCKDFLWPDTVTIAPESKDFYVNATRANPVEDILFDLIAPIVAIHPTKSILVATMADINPSRLSWALKPLAFKPTDEMIATAQTTEGRKVLLQLKASV